MSPHERHRLLPDLSSDVRAEVELLLHYPPRSAGGIMTTEFVRLDPGMTVAEALARIRTEACDKESIYACYVLEAGSDRLLGAVSLRDLIMAEPDARVAAVMRRRPISVGAHEPQQKAAEKISKYNLLAVPVVEEEGRVVGFVTVDDVIDVMVEAETENALRMGAVEPGALDQPYMSTPFATMVRKRATWLVVLFLGEMLTATAMGYFEDEIAKAVVLALFVPLIISSGGNSGSQASTIIIRAMALGEFRLAGLVEDCPARGPVGPRPGIDPRSDRLRADRLVERLLQHLRSALDAGRLDGGVLAGGRRALGDASPARCFPWSCGALGADPATSSAPFVATLVDVTGLVIYFTVAIVVMRGTIL